MNDVERAVPLVPVAKPGRHRPHVDLFMVGVLVGIYDLVILAGAGILAVLPHPALTDSAERLTTVAIAGLVIGGWGWLHTTRSYSVNRFVQRSLLQRVAALTLAIAILFGAALSLTRSLDPGNRPMVDWLLAWAAMAGGGSLGLRVALALVLRRWRAEGSLKQVVAIVGGGDLTVRLVDWLRRTSADSVEIVGVFDDRKRSDAAHAHFASLLSGGTDDLIELTQEIAIDRIIVALPHAAELRLMEILRKLKRIPVDICLAPDQVGFAAAVMRPGDYSGLPIVKVYGRPLERGNRLAKRGIDLVLAGAALGALGPLMLFLAALVRWRIGRPVLVCEDRLGYGNRVIRVFAFRSDQSALGRWMRASGADTLAQLFNVVAGDLSLVGPRAMPVAMPITGKLTQQVVSEYALRHRVKPGLTGWAQVNGHFRRAETMEELFVRVQHDLHYIDQWSLWRDAEILARTLFLALSWRQEE